jgi:hypothetical protein
MASVVLTNCKVSVGGSDISAYVLGITLNFEAEAVKETRMGNTTEVNKGGVKKWGGTIQFKQDYADNLVDEIVFALIGTTGAFSGIPVNDTVSANNPNYNGTCLFTGYAPISGQHGELAKSALSFVSAGDLTRSTS